MIVDANTVESAVISVDVCIVGGGPAGLAVALELDGTELTVALLESGNKGWDRRTQILSASATTRRAYNTLDTRRRALGGTISIWGGRWMSFGPLDFEERPWVPHSGWPFSRTALAPFYDRARHQFKTGFDDHLAAKAEADLMQQLPVEAAGLAARLVERSDSRELIEGFERQLAESKNVTVYLMANALGVEVNRREEKVVAVPVGTLAGKRFRVQPRLTVLAAGGIENPRLLLESGLDATNDEGPLVGAFFMDHPYMELGPLQNAVRPTPTDFNVDGRNERTVLAPHGVITMGEGVLRTEQLVDGAAYIRVAPGFRHAASYNSAGMTAARELTRYVRRREIPPRLGELALIAARSAHEVAGSAFRAAAGSARSRNDVGLRLMMESSPERTSRISLSSKKDRLGIRLASVDWRTTQLDALSANRFVDLLRDMLAGEGFGLLPRQSNGRWPGRILPGNHHAGATRMHVDPQQGVVDENARMHSVSNLYIAGSSVFPTSGIANPTLTIAALAIRLADHIRAIL